MDLHQREIGTLHMIEHRPHVNPIKGAALERQELGAGCDEIEMLIETGVCRTFLRRDAFEIIDKGIDRNKFRSLWKKMANSPSAAADVKYTPAHPDMIVDRRNAIDLDSVIFDRPFVPGLVHLLAFVPLVESSRILQITPGVHDAILHSNDIRGGWQFCYRVSKNVNNPGVQHVSPVFMMNEVTSWTSL